MPRKYEFDFDFNKTISEVFEDLYQKYTENKLFRKILEKITYGKNDEIIQRLTLNNWGVDPAVFAFHDIACGQGFDGTIIDYMTAAGINAYTDRNYDVKHYWNEELSERMPIIIGPYGNELKFPIEDK